MREGDRVKEGGRVEEKKGDGRCMEGNKKTKQEIR
jgi:hypothetical protein